MKKLLVILAIFFAISTIQAQDELSFGVSVEYQVKEPGDNWMGWIDCESPVLIYMDLGFGFMAVQNGYNDRFILNTLDNTYDGDDKKVFFMDAVDKEKKPCTIEFTYFASGNIAITIRYSDIHYSYLIEQEFGKTGYPVDYFKNSKSAEETGKFPEGTLQL